MSGITPSVLRICEVGRRSIWMKRSGTAYSLLGEVPARITPHLPYKTIIHFFYGSEIFQKEYSSAEYALSFFLANQPFYY